MRKDDSGFTVSLAAFKYTEYFGGHVTESKQVTISYFALPQRQAFTGSEYFFFFLFAKIWYNITVFRAHSVQVADSRT
jgi:hypothetical protein